MDVKYSTGIHREWALDIVICSLIRTKDAHQLWLLAQNYVLMIELTTEECILE